MKFKALNSFIGGIYEKKNIENRIPDQFLIKQINIDSDETGRLEQRPGYDYWEDLKDNNSGSSQTSLPDVSTFTGFGERIQALTEYADVAGIRYLLVTSNRKAYIQESETETSKVWTCLNPTGNIDFDETSKHMDIVSYLNIIFFNDYRNNVYMYDTYAYSRSGWIVAGNRYIYFAGDRIFFRNFSTYDAEYHIHDISNLTRPGAPNDEFHISGDYQHHYSDGDIIAISGSTGNDGDYIVSDINYTGGETKIKVSTAIPDATADGTISSVYRILIEDNEVNFAGKRIYDSLVDIGYIGAGKVIVTADLLKLGFCYRTGNSTIGYKYYVIDNSKNQRASDKCYIIKFDDRFIAEDYVELAMDTNGEVLCIGYYNNNLYVWCEDGEIHVLDEDLSDTAALGAGTDVADIKGVTISGGSKQYAITVNDSGEIYLATQAIPSSANDNDFIYKDVFQAYSTPTGGWSGHEIVFDSSNNMYIGGIYSSGMWVYKYTSNFTFLNYKQVDTGHSIFIWYAFSKVWVGGYNNSGTLRINPVTLVVDGTIAAENFTYAICDDGTYIWCSCSTSSNQLKKFDPTTLAQVGSAVSVGASPNKGIVYDGSQYIWSCGYQYAYRVDKTTHSKYSIYLGYGVQTAGIHIAGGYVWVSSQTDNRIYKIDPTSLTIDSEITVPENGSWKMTDDGTYLYVTSINTLFIFKYKMSDNSNVGRIYPAGGYNEKYYDCEYISSLGRLYCLGFSPFNFTTYIRPNNDDYQNIMRFKTDGDIYYNNSDWRHIWRCGLASNQTNIKPIVYDNNNLYFGSSKETPDMGVYVQVNTQWFTDSHNSSRVSDYRLKVIDGFDWFLKQGGGSDEHRASNSWSWNSGLITYDNLEDYGTTYYNNLVFHIYKAVSTFDSIVDRIKYLGTPKSPFVSFENATSDFIQGTKFRYYMVYKMYNEKTTILSPHSEGIEIPQLHTEQSFPHTNINLGTDTITLNSHGYSDGDIVRFWITGTDVLPDGIDEDTNYYIVNSAANTFQIEPSVGGGVIDLSGSPSGTIYVIKCSDEPIKIVITELNLENNYGFDVYNFDDVEEIHVYRSKKEFESGGITTYWSDAVLIETLEKYDPGTGSDWFVMTNPTTTTYGDDHSEYAEDNNQSYTYNPFTFANVFNYPVNHICVHKNRLILINRIDYANASVIEYSEVNTADAIPPDNKRGISSGDGDYMVAGISMGDYLYLFKTEHVYAILGDVVTGQLIDIDRNIGTDYKNLIVQFEGIIYFMNNKSIYAISGNKPAINIAKDRLKNYFDTNASNCIDFANIKDNGFACVDKKNRYIKFYVPQKANGLPQIENNTCVVYDIETHSFKIYEYANNIFIENTVTDILSSNSLQLLADYSGNIYRIHEKKNDFGKAINWLIRTKAFNIGSNLVRKHFKLIKIVGRFFNNLRLTYWIDGQRQIGDIINRETENNRDEVTVDILNGRRANTMMIEMNGKDVNSVPVSIEEILIGYDNKRGVR